MSDFESQLKKENENIKRLFNYNGDETQLKLLTEYFNNSKNGPNFLIGFLENFSKRRPHQTDVSKELVKCVYSCFPEQILEIQQFIKENTVVLKFIIFPEEYPINENKEQQEMFLLLQKDDIDGFIGFLSKNPTIDITKEQKVEKYDILLLSL